MAIQRCRTQSQIEIGLASFEDSKNIYNYLIQLWLEEEKKPLQKRKLPYIFSIKHSNKYWQVYESPHETIHLLNAYYDDRSNTERLVRILGMVKETDETHVSLCKLWFNEAGNVTAVMSNITARDLIWNKKWEFSQPVPIFPYLLSCAVPSIHKNLTPFAVSLLPNEKENLNTILPVITNIDSDDFSQQKFAVCVKGLNFLTADVAERLIEWLEILKAFRVSKVIMYVYSVHTVLSSLLMKYQEEGLVELIKVTLPGYLPNDDVMRYYFLQDNVMLRRKFDAIHYNDCFYSNFKKYSFIALLDIDELIFSTLGSDWWSMVFNDTNINRTSIQDENAYCFQNFYYKISAFEDSKENFRILDQYWRARNHTQHNSYVKCLYPTSQAVTLTNHFPMKCLSPACRIHYLDPDIGRLNHYRHNCPPELIMFNKCPLLDIVYDNSGDRVKFKIQERIESKIADFIKL